MIVTLYILKAGERPLDWALDLGLGRRIGLGLHSEAVLKSVLSTRT